MDADVRFPNELGISQTSLTPAVATSDKIAPTINAVMIQFMPPFKVFELRSLLYSI